MTRDDHTYCLIVGGLWLVLFLLPAGCASRDMASPQVGFQPAGHDNEFKVAESLPIGDTAGDDLIKDNVSKTMALEIADNKIDGLEQKIAEVQTDNQIVAKEIRRVEQRQAGRNLIDLSGGAVLLLIFGIAVFAIDRWLAYRQGLAVVQQAVADQGDEDLIKSIKPRVRAMGKRRKRIFDSALQETRHG